MKGDCVRYKVKEWINLASSYLLFLAGYFVSRIGDSLYTFAIPWISYELTKSSIVMGSLFATSVLPIVLFGPFIGVLVDRVKKRNLMVYSDILRAAIVALIPLLYMMNELRLWHLYVLSFMLTILSMAFDVSTITIIPKLVVKEHLTKANSAYQLVGQLSDLLGPIVAGVCIASIGDYQTLWLNVISFGGTLLALLFLTGLKMEHITTSENNVWKSMKDGFAWLKNDRLNICLSLQAMIGNFGYSVAFAILIFYLREKMHLSAEQIGMNLAIISVGGFIGSILAAPIEKRLGKRTAIPLLLGIGTTGFFIASIKSFWLAPGIGLGIVGICNVAWNVMVTSLRQETVPKEILGRVLSFSRVLTRMAMPIGALFGGLLSAISPSSVFIVAALAKFLEVLIAILWIRPSLQSKPMKDVKNESIA
jgi:MFS family permease